MNTLRHDLIYRQEAVSIEGIPQLFEDRRSDLEVHGTRFINRFDAAKRKIQVASISQKPGPTERAQEVENWGYSLFADWESAKDYHVDSPRTLAIGGMVYYGPALLRLDFCQRLRNEMKSFKTAEELSAALDALLKKFTINPFELRWPHWNTIAFEPDLSMVAEKGEATVSSLLMDIDEDTDLRKFLTSGTQEETGGDWDRVVPVMHLETREYIYDVVQHGDEGHMVQCRPNVAGRPWYVFASGNLTPETEPKHRYRPLIAPIYPVVEKLRVLGTLLNSGALQEGRTGWQLVDDGKQAAQNWLDWMNKPSGDRPTISFDLSQAAVQNPPPGKHYELMPVPPKDVIVSAYQEAKRELQEYGFPAPLSPDQSLTASSSSGYHASQEMDQAAMFIDPGLRRLAGMDKELLILCGDIIKGLDLTVTVPVFKKSQGEGAREMVTVTADHFKDLDISVELSARLASTDYAEKESDRRDLELGLMSKHAYMTKWNEDPLDELERIDNEKLGMAIDEMADQQVLTLIQQVAQVVTNDEAAAQGVPLPPPPPQQAGAIPPQGGPAEPGGTRNARPQNGSMPGLGATITPEEQAVAMQV